MLLSKRALSKAYLFLPRDGQREPPGKGIDKVVLYGAHGVFRTDKVIYEF